MARPDFSIIAKCVYGSDMREPFVNLSYWVPDAAPAGNPYIVAGAFAQAMYTAFEPLYTAVMPTEARFFGVEAEYRTSAGDTYSSGYGVSSPGTISGDSLPDFTAVVIQKRTNIAARSGRGRLYIGCVPESFSDTDKLSDSALLLYADLAAQYHLPIPAVGTDFQPFHQSEGGDTWTQLQGLIVNRNFGTQRRRRLRRLV